MRARTIVTILYVSEFLLAYAVVAWMLYNADVAYRLQWLRSLAQTCQATAYHLGRVGMQAEIKYRELVDAEHMN